jgi:hypothetical protein
VSEIEIYQSQLPTADAPEELSGVELIKWLDGRADEVDSQTALIAGALETYQLVGSALRWKSAEEITRELTKDGVTQRTLAKDIGKSQAHVSRSVRMWAKYGESHATLEASYSALEHDLMIANPKPAKAIKSSEPIDVRSDEERAADEAAAAEAAANATTPKTTGSTTPADPWKFAITALRAAMDDDQEPTKAQVAEVQGIAHRLEKIYA